MEYPSRVSSYDFVMNIIRFCAPFAINVLSAVIIIITTTRLQTAAKKPVKSSNDVLWTDKRTQTSVDCTRDLSYSCHTSFSHFISTWLYGIIRWCIVVFDGLFHLIYSTNITFFHLCVSIENIQRRISTVNTKILLLVSTTISWAYVWHSGLRLKMSLIRWCGRKSWLFLFDHHSRGLIWQKFLFLLFFSLLTFILLLTNLHKVVFCCDNVGSNEKVSGR